MTTNAQMLLLVSCRHCLRPITVAMEIDDDEVTVLRAHLRGCAVDSAPPPRGLHDDVLRHYWVVQSE